MPLFEEMMVRVRVEEFLSLVDWFVVEYPGVEITWNELGDDHILVRLVRGPATPFLPPPAIAIMSAAQRRISVEVPPVIYNGIMRD